MPDEIKFKEWCPNCKRFEDHEDASYYLPDENNIARRISRSQCKHCGDTH